MCSTVAKIFDNNFLVDFSNGDLVSYKNRKDTVYYDEENKDNDDFNGGSESQGDDSFKTT